MNLQPATRNGYSRPGLEAYRPLFMEMKIHLLKAVRACLAMAVFWLGAFGTNRASAEPLKIDVTGDIPPAVASPYGPGTSKNPAGDEITADSRSYFLNGKPWVPIVGEFHYSRYPREEWRDELLKMKSGGINTVSTYVFWIHHEEEQGKFDWNDQRSLRDFIKLCQDLGLKVMVRMGPWCHGEVRNGGFPDWVQNSGTKLRSTDQAYLKLVEPFYRETAKQMEGLLWKEGGPIIAVQLDNETANTNYLLKLKELARFIGVDVPFYMMTGWQGGIPKEGLIPLFGGYSDGFWGGSKENYRREYMFTDVRAVNDLGAQLTSINPTNSAVIAQFPYSCVEIGGGMMSAYRRRILIDPDNIAALALAKLGSGNNMPGYYMYQGGTNPEGKLSYLHEDHPNQLPMKDYDFQAPLGNCGQVREQYHLLREQHVFLQQFGNQLARMPAYFPEKRPTDLKDFETLRWNMRSDGKAGFLFFNNQQPYVPLPEKKGVQFEVKTKSGSMLIPSHPVDLPSGSYGFWPVNLDCDGIRLDYATAQPLSILGVQENESYVFLAELKGIPVEISLECDLRNIVVNAGESSSAGGHVIVSGITPGPTAAFSIKNSSGRRVTFIVLSADQARQFYRVSFSGIERALLTTAAVLEDSGLRFQTTNATDLSFAFLPAPSEGRQGQAALAGKADGVFTRFVATDLHVAQLPQIAVSLEQAAGPNAATANGATEEAWKEASVYKLDIPETAAGRHLILNIQYNGDAARLYTGEKLFNDHYSNGSDPLAIALWRIPKTEWPTIRLKVLPVKKANTAEKPVTVSVSEQIELNIHP